MAAKTGTYTLIASDTLGSLTASVTFSSISSAYTDLVLVITPTIPTGAYDILMRVGNGTVDSGNNYSVTRLSGTGTAANSTRSSNASGMFFTYYGYPTSTNPSTTIINLIDYANTTTNKSMLIRSGNAAAGTEAIVGLWRSTAAINIITMSLDAATNFSSGSTFKLYGIEAAR